MNRSDGPDICTQCGEKHRYKQGELQPCPRCGHQDEQPARE